MGVGSATSSKQTISLSHYSSFGAVHCGSVGKGGHRENVIPSFSRPSPFGPQEGLGQEKSYPSPINPQQFRPVPSLQNGNCVGGKESPLSRGVYHISRPQGCLLAHPHQELFLEIPGISFGNSEMSFSGPPIGAEHRPPFLQSLRSPS